MRSASFAARSCRVGALLLLVAVALPSASLGAGPGGAPTVAPVILSTVPAADVLGVALNPILEVRFSEPMNETTVSHTIQPAVVLAASWPASDLLRLQPAPPGLTNCTVYQVRVQGRDADEGLPLTAGSVPNPWSFMTTCDRPFLVGTVPAEGDTNVRADTDIVVTFSEPMDCIGVQILFLPALPPPGSIVTSCDASQTVVTGRLSGGTTLQPGTRYRVSASGTGLDGNRLVASLSPNPWAFDVNAPPVISLLANRRLMARDWAGNRKLLRLLPCAQAPTGA